MFGFVRYLQQRSTDNVTEKGYDYHQVLANSKSFVLFISLQVVMHFSGVPCAGLKLIHLTGTCGVGINTLDWHKKGWT